MSEYAALLNLLTEVPPEARKISEIEGLLEAGDGYEILPDNSVDPVPCAVIKVCWHGHLNDLSAFSAELEVNGLRMAVSLESLLRIVNRKMPDGRSYSGARLRPSAS